MAPHVNTKLLLGCRGQRNAEIMTWRNLLGGNHKEPCVESISYQTFEGFPTYVATVWPALLVLAGFVADESALLGEALLAHVAAVGTLAGVCPVVFVQTRWSHIDELVKDTLDFWDCEMRIPTVRPNPSVRGQQRLLPCVRKVLPQR